MPTGLARRMEPTAEEEETEDAWFTDPEFDIAELDGCDDDWMLVHSELETLEVTVAFEPVLEETWLEATDELLGVAEL